MKGKFMKVSEWFDRFDILKNILFDKVRWLPFYPWVFFYINWVFLL